MDHISIPSFALLRYGTVIVRLKMEKFSGHFWESCHRAEVERESFSGVVHRVSSCEHCTRTRIVSQCSDCDSALVGKCRTRPYRTRAAKSRYVNVCAAVCLLLLVGGLTPQSSAAPHRTRTMERTRRASDQENETWFNPCDYELSKMIEIEYKPEYAEKVSNSAKSALASARMYMEDIANLHNFKSFDSMYATWKGTDWLRNHSWFADKAEIMLWDKLVGQPIENKTGLDKLMTSKQLGEILPVLTKAMKMLGASLRAIANSLRDTDPNEKLIKSKLNNTASDMQYVLCLTFDVVRARNLKMLPLLDREIPTYNDPDEVARDVYLVYRDTLHFLEYVDRFFDVMKNVNIIEE